MTKATTRLHWDWRGALVVLAFLALALRILVPPGMMPGPTGHGTVALVICTGHGPVSAPGPARTPTHHSGSEAPCAFAGHAAVAGPALIALLGEPIERSPPVPAHANPGVAPGLGLAAPPPPSQAPPRASV